MPVLPCRARFLRSRWLGPLVHFLSARSSPCPPLQEGRGRVVVSRSPCGPSPSVRPPFLPSSPTAPQRPCHQSGPFLFVRAPTQAGTYVSAGLAGGGRSMPAPGLKPGHMKGPEAGGLVRQALEEGGLAPLAGLCMGCQGFAFVPSQLLRGSSDCGTQSGCVPDLQN